MSLKKEHLQAENLLDSRTSHVLKLEDVLLQDLETQPYKLKGGG